MKENININDYINEFNISAKNIKNLKEKIENEINIINESYEKVEKETNIFFETKHAELIKEENNIKDKLNL